MTNIVVLAAGKGTRMKSDRPKVLHGIGGKPMIQRVVDTARELKPSALVLVVGHKADMLEAHFAGQGDIRFAMQAEQLGTGHAVQMAVPHLADEQPTLVLYGDVPLIQSQSLKPLVEIARKGGVGLMTLTLANPTGYGRILRNAAGEVCGIVEQKDASAEQLKITEVNTGILCCPTPLLKSLLSGLKNSNAQGEYYLTDVIAAASEKGVSVRSVSAASESEVAGVNSRVQQAELERTLQLAQALKLMETGVQLLDPARIDIRGSLVCGADVVIDVNCVFEGDVTLADGVQVGPNCCLKNVKVGLGTRIKAFSHFEDAVIGASGEIGPYARLRPGAELADEVHIGNFVEVKKAVIGNQSKVNHLSYVGDAVIGQRVNIGAGTITCNYDGANKHLTEIEDDVFVGSDTQLVAPVKVEKGATLGAGTTLTKTAPAGSLTVSRAKQVTINGWVRPVKKPKTSE